jgi:broad specificity phosphatase PhoE
MHVYFVRHGESEANILHQFSNRGIQHPLTEKGRQQAYILADMMRGKQITRIFTSPLLRAMQTAEILSGVLKIPCTPTDALREFDCGILEGKSDLISWQRFDRLLEEWFVCHNWDSRIEEGESFNDIRRRFETFINNLRIIKLNLVLVGHGGIFRAMLPLLMDNLDDDYGKDHHLGNTGYVLATLEQHRFTCLEWHE